ncbi:hypothetical protein [Chroococcidiopsis sp. SAG 2025]|nr:hypothetical protein [Chroococcidiopsis sp. SAG 2025]
MLRKNRESGVGSRGEKSDRERSEAIGSNYQLPITNNSSGKCVA